MMTSHSPDVTVIGDVARDVNVRIDGRLPDDLVVAGDTPARIRMSAGGSAATTAAWLAHQDVPVRLISARGDDDSGAIAEGELRSLGVETRFENIEGQPTGTVVVIVDSTGERTMLPDPGANAFLSPQWCEREVAGRHLHLSAYPWFRAETRASIESALRQARAQSMTVSIDLNSHSLVRAQRDALSRLLDGIDVVFANADEWEALAGTWHPPIATLVVVKLGASGARWIAGDDAGASPAVTSDVVDTVGAGDAFAAGFLAARLSGAGIAEAVAAGNALARECIAHVGPAPRARG